VVQQCYFFVGLKFDQVLVQEMKEQGANINLSAPVNSFVKLVREVDRSERDPSCDIVIQVSCAKLKRPDHARPNQASLLLPRGGFPQLEGPHWHLPRAGCEA